MTEQLEYPMEGECKSVIIAKIVVEIIEDEEVVNGYC
jgi:hypothetical protein